MGTVYRCRVGFRRICLPLLPLPPPPRRSGPYCTGPDRPPTSPSPYPTSTTSTSNTIFIYISENREPVYISYPTHIYTYIIEVESFTRPLEARSGGGTRHSITGLDRDSASLTDKHILFKFKSRNWCSTGSKRNRSHIHKHKTKTTPRTTTLRNTPRTEQRLNVAQ